MIEELKDKIQIIRDYYEDSSLSLSEDAKQRLKDVEHRIAEISLKSAMANNPLMANLQNQLKEKVVSIEKELGIQRVIDKPSMFKREVLFAKLDWYGKELGMFIDSEEAFTQINKQLDGWIKKLK